MFAGHEAGFSLTDGMQWYYAAGAERRGPLDTIAFNRLVNNGTIGPDTLVWRTGMAEWQKWAVVAPEVADVVNPPVEENDPVVGSAPVMETPWPGQPAGEHPDDGIPMEVLWRRIQERGYHTSISGCLTRGWDGLKPSYWPALGVTLLYLLLSLVIQNLPVIGFVATFVVAPQLTAGIWLYFIRLLRGEEATVNDLFAGFRRGFGQLAQIAVLQILALIPLLILVVSVLINQREHGVEPGTGMKTALLAVGLVTSVVMFRWQFAHAIVIDRGYGAVEAIKLSWRIIGLRFWTLLGLVLVLGCVATAGALALLIGLVFVMPILFACFVQAYEDAVRPDA